MLKPKKSIPKLASSALVLAGCSGSDGGVSSDLAEALSAFCISGVECFPEENVQECINNYNGYLALYNLTPECQTAAASYFDCGTALSCDERAMSSNSCDDEFDAIFDICVPR